MGPAFCAMFCVHTAKCRPSLWQPCNRRPLPLQSQQALSRPRFGLMQGAATAVHQADGGDPRRSGALDRG